MKIKNLQESLLEAKLMEADDVNSLDGSQAEAVNDVVDGGKEAGIAVDKNAAKQEVETAKKVIDDFKLNPYAATAKLSKVEGVLQASLEQAVFDKEAGVDSDYPDVLIYGLAGFGKTAGVKKFCRDHGIYMLSLDAKTLRKEELAGLPTKSVDADGNEIQGSLPTKTFLDLKKHDKVIVVLDEVNRARPDVIGTLLTFVADHDLPFPGYDSNGIWRPTTHFDNILFTVCMINPASRDLFQDVNELDPAFMNRFNDVIEQDANKREFLAVIKNIYNTILANPVLLPAVKSRYQRQLDIATALLTNKNFKFDGRDEAVAAHKAQRGSNGHPMKALSYRTLTKSIRSCDGTKANFLQRLQTAGYLDATKIMIENCLATYVDQQNKANSVFQKTTPAAQKYSQSAVSDVETALRDFEVSLN